MLAELYPQFFTVVILHLFAVMSPGPDFALILRQSLIYNRKISVVTSFGIGVGILFHVFLSITGIGIIISNSTQAFMLIKISGGIYLAFLGFNSFFNKSKINTDRDKTISKSNISIAIAFSNGLLTNILNPKATLFFLSLYSFIVSEQPSIYIQAFYGIWMSIVTSIWFCLLSIILTNDIFIKKLSNFFNIIQSITAIMLIAIGMKLIFFN